MFVYIDGGPSARQEEIKELMANSKFPDAEIVCRVNNWGIGRHLIDARRRLFDELGYDRILLLEDDLVLGKITSKPYSKFPIGLVNMTI